MEDLHIIYMTHCDLFNRNYIGRHKVHNEQTLDPAYIGSGHLLLKLIKKHGKEHFHRTILCRIRTSDLEKVKRLERFYIKRYDVIFPHGLNWLSGDLEEDNPMIREWNRNIVRKNSKRIFSGVNNPMYGTHFSEERSKLQSQKLKAFYASEKSKEVKEKFSKMCQNRHWSDEVKAKISKKNKGKKRTPEQRARIAKAVQEQFANGRRSPNLGKHLSKHTRKLISLHHAYFGGKKNPCYGVKYHWITNGVNNMRLKDGEEMPKGFHKGFHLTAFNS